MAEATKRAPKSALTVSAEPVFRFVVTEGPDTGHAFSFDGTEAPRVLLGSSAICELRLADPQVSRRHLSLVAANGEVQARDLGSTNGTLVNGVRILEAALRGGESIRVGATTLRVERGAEDGEPLVSDAMGFGRLLGRSAAMRRLYSALERLAKSTAPLVIEGETGTGKERAAEAIHEASPRASAPFVVVDAATLAATQVEALFEEANGGTLVIDEIADLSPDVQPVLARAIEAGKRAGSHAARIITTTRRDLDREVADGRFREELFFRLAVTRIELPPLRERLDDLAYLAEHLWTESTAFPSSALERMAGYGWPGNVRELESFVTRLASMGDPLPRASAPTTTTGDYLDAVISEHLSLSAARERVVAEFERRYVADAFDRNGQNVTKAAAASGVARRYFRALRAKQK